MKYFLSRHLKPNSSFLLKKFIKLFLKTLSVFRCLDIANTQKQSMCDAVDSSKPNLAKVSWI